MFLTTKYAIILRNALDTPNTLKGEPINQYSNYETKRISFKVFREPKEESGTSHVSQENEDCWRIIEQTIKISVITAMIHFKRFDLSSKSAEKDISAFLSEYTDIIPRDNIFITDTYFLAFFDDADEATKTERAVKHQFKRDLLQLEVQRAQHERKYRVAKLLGTKKGKNPNLELEARDEVETIEAQIQLTKQKLSELNA